MMGSADTELGDANLRGNSDNAITQDGLYEFELGKYLLSKGRPGGGRVVRELFSWIPGLRILQLHVRMPYSWRVPR